MSHTMNIKCELRDQKILSQTCEKLGLKMLEKGEHSFYSGSAEGVGVQLDGWKYPIVIKQDGTVSYDNYNGSWGNIDELHKLEANYGVEKAKEEARNQGYAYDETLCIEKNEIELIIYTETGPEQKEIKLNFRLTTGECKVEAFGYTGEFCKDATKFLKETLGESSNFQQKEEWFKKNMVLNEQLNSDLCG